MKKRLLLFCCAFIAIALQHAQAKVWRVNSNSNYDGSAKWGDNYGGTIAYPVFKQLSQALSSNLVSATAGDTIHVEGSNIDYSGVTVTKKVIIIGPGYFLNENPNVSASGLSARLDDITFNTGSAGSQLLGMYVFGFYGVDINVSNIVIKRCRIDRSVSLDDNLSDIFILQNFFANSAGSTQSAVVPDFYGFATNFIFDNNICKSPLILESAGIVRTAQEVNNNVFDCPAISGGPSIQLNTTSFKNNILKTNTATVSINNGQTGSNVSYNVSSSASNQFGTTNSNIVVTTISSIFVTSGTADGLYQLKSGSAASNNGSDGTDRGAFGGLAAENKYTLSGLAPIPVIYQITSSGVAGPAGLPVTIKARTIK